jgi:hypothetical protein
VNNIEYEEQMVAWDSGEEELEEEWNTGEIGKILDCVFFLWIWCAKAQESLKAIRFCSQVKTFFSLCSSIRFGMQLN